MPLPILKYRDLYLPYITYKHNEYILDHTVPTIETGNCHIHFTNTMDALDHTAPHINALWVGQGAARTAR
eukprot:COSAG03_NODE_21813_length_299_cov_0.655000_1_plen_70_part_00